MAKKVFIVYHIPYIMTRKRRKPGLEKAEFWRIGGRRWI
jgi:hypothetical protein